MKRRVFRRIFLVYAIVLLFSIALIDVYITQVIRTDYIYNLRKSLSTQAGLMSERIPIQPRNNLDRLCRQLKEKTGARVTVIDPDGKVLGDSDTDSSLMDSHEERPEIRESTDSRNGWSIRYSETIQEELLYVAKKIKAGDAPGGFIRLAVPLADINQSTNMLRIKINTVIILLLVFSGTVFIWQTLRTRRYIHRIIDYTGALSQGLFIKRLHLEGGGEFTELAENLNSMASELEGTIKAREEETNRLNVILRSIPDALFLVNTEGVIELTNNAARDLFKHAELEGRPFLEVIRSPELLGLFDSVKHDHASLSGDVLIDYPEEKSFSVQVTPIFFKEGKLEGMVCIFHETTHIRKLEQVRKDFVANVSHEIKTPVTAIKGFAETLIDGAIEDRKNAEKFLRTIRSHSERLNRLVEDLLTLSRIELGVIRINKSELDLSDVLSGVIDTMIVQAAEKNLEILKSFALGTTRIKADRDRLEQILLNLVENAVKFTESGEIRVGTAQEETGKYFYVQDGGIGIPQKYLSRIGERFFRVDPSRSRSLGGTGLGFAIVKHLVRAHGWEIKLESEVGKGTIVKIIYEYTSPRDRK